MPVETVEQAALDGGLTPDQARAVADDYGDAQLDALRLALGAVALAALLSLLVHAATADHIARGDRGRCRGDRGDRVASRMAPAPTRRALEHAPISEESRPLPGESLRTS